MNVGSLFAGIGGFDLGFIRAGFDISFHAENEPNCRKLLSERFQGVRNYGDISKLNPKVIRDTEILVGGFPCQDVSIAGRRDGLGGSRSVLFFEFMRLAEATRAPWVVIENVAGLLSSHKGVDMGIVLGTLSQLGYRWAYRVLDAQYFGVPQRRRRVFIVGHLGGGAGPAEVLFESEIRPRDSKTGRKAKASTPTASDESPSFGLAYSTTVDAQTNMTPPLTVRGGEGRTHPGWVARPIAIEDVGGKRSGGEGVGIGLSDDVMYTLQSSPRHQHGVAIPNEKLAPVLMRWREGKDGGGKGELLSEDASLTLASANDQYLFNANGHQEYAVRRLTPLECERLQGFPDGWTEGFNDSVRYKMLGNAVCVNVAEWIARRMMDVVG